MSNFSIFSGTLNFLTRHSSSVKEVIKNFLLYPVLVPDPSLRPLSCGHPSFPVPFIFYHTYLPGRTQLSPTVPLDQIAERHTALL